MYIDIQKLFINVEELSLSLANIKSCRKTPLNAVVSLIYREKLNTTFARSNRSNSLEYFSECSEQSLLLTPVLSVTAQIAIRK